MPHNSRGHLLIVVFINDIPWNQKVEVWVVVGFTFIECSYKARVRIKGQWEVVGNDLSVDFSARVSLFTCQSENVDSPGQSRDHGGFHSMAKHARYQRERPLVIFIQLRGMTRF